MAVYRFTVAGQWVPEAKRTYRLPTTRYGVRRVDTARAKEFKAAARYAAGQFWGDRAVLDEPLTVEYIFRRPKPKSYRKYENRYHRGPDCDNLAKILNDALQSVIFENDSAICELTVGKCFGARWEVQITISTDDDWPYRELRGSGHDEQPAAL